MQSKLHTLAFSQTGGRAPSIGTFTGNLQEHVRVRSIWTVIYKHEHESHKIWISCMFLFRIAGELFDRGNRKELVRRKERVIENINGRLRYLSTEPPPCLL